MKSTQVFLEQSREKTTAGLHQKVRFRSVNFQKRITEQFLDKIIIPFNIFHIFFIVSTQFGWI